MKVRKKDSCATIETVPIDEQDRQICLPSSGDVSATEQTLCRKPTIRCDQSQRELYRNHFPPER